MNRIIPAQCASTTKRQDDLLPKARIYRSAEDAGATHTVLQIPADAPTVIVARHHYGASRFNNVSIAPSKLGLAKRRCLPGEAPHHGDCHLMGEIHSSNPHRHHRLHTTSESALRRTTRIAIIDDDSGSRDALSALMNLSGHRCVGFDSAESYLAYERRDQFGCVLLDLDLPGMDGLALLREVADTTSSAFIVVTGTGEIALAVQAMKAGAIDFLEKPIDHEALLSALTVALERPSNVEFRERFARLTSREREITDLILQGMTTNSIAERLEISRRTVETHRGHVLDKLEASNVAELVRITILAQQI